MEVSHLSPQGVPQDNTPGAHGSHNSVSREGYRPHAHTPFLMGPHDRGQGHVCRHRTFTSAPVMMSHRMTLPLKYPHTA